MSPLNVIKKKLKAILDEDEDYTIEKVYNDYMESRELYKELYDCVLTYASEIQSMKDSLIGISVSEKEVEIYYATLHVYHLYLEFLEDEKKKLLTHKVNYNKLKRKEKLLTTLIPILDELNSL